MGRPASEKVGRGICPSVGCGAPVTYRRSSGGMLTHRCDACDSTGYAEPGGTAYAARMATIKKPASDPPAPEPTTKTEPAPKPDKGPATSGAAFDLANL